MDKAQRDLQHRVRAHMLPTCAAQGLTIPQHKAICAAVIELLDAEVCPRDKRPTVPSWKPGTLPKGLDKVQRHKDAEKNIV